MRAATRNSQLATRMTYSIKHIQEIIGGKLLNKALFNASIERLLFDSRHLVFPTRTLFFAFKSNRQNGHQFIPELYEKGVRKFSLLPNKLMQLYSHMPIF